MKIEWNKVTWYSKILALALFVALPFIGFYYGTQYGQTLAALNAAQQNATNGASTAAPANNDYFSNVSEWQTARVDAAGFSIAYPLGFNEQAYFSPQPAEDWRMDANGNPGTKSFELDIPSIFEPHTNFVDAKLTVGESRNDKAVTGCLTPDQGGEPGTTSSTKVVNGITFSVFSWSGAGAGNYYEMTSYRTLHAGQCYAIEYTVHSGQIANYPPEYHMMPFDKAEVTDVFDRIVSTFKFL